jgi:general stress protein 26
MSQHDHDHREHLKELGELIKDVRIAMLTTTTPDGRLVSRPLATQDVEFDGDLWFATGADSGKVGEIQADAHVNVAYANPSKNSFVSVSGTASIVHDRAKIDELWSPAMKVYFPEGKDDPNLRLIRVRAETAEYWDGPGSAVGKAIYMMSAAVTGDAATMSENERVDLR